MYIVIVYISEEPVVGKNRCSNETVMGQWQGKSTVFAAMSMKYYYLYFGKLISDKGHWMYSWIPFKDYYVGLT